MREFIININDFSKASKTCMVEGTDKNIKKFENELKKLNILV